MGCHHNIDASKFPKQGDLLGSTVDVCFNYDLKNRLPGKIVRDDIEDPFRTIIELKDGRMIMATECQYHPVSKD